MSGGLAATLGTLMYTGIGASAFDNGGPLVRLGEFVMESAVNPALWLFQIAFTRAGRSGFGITSCRCWAIP